MGAAWHDDYFALFIFTSKQCFKVTGRALTTVGAWPCTGALTGCGRGYILLGGAGQYAGVLTGWGREGTLVGGAWQYVGVLTDWGGVCTLMGQIDLGDTGVLTDSGWYTHWDFSFLVCKHVLFSKHLLSICNNEISCSAQKDPRVGKYKCTLNWAA